MSPIPRGSARERLLQGALQCLGEKGYAATTARDVAAASGANMRSIAYHFGSTRGLLLAALSLNFRRWLAPLIASAEGDGPPQERLLLGLDQFSRRLPESAPVVRAWLEAVVMAGQDAELKAVIARNQEQFRQALAATLAEAGVPSPAETAEAVITTMDGLIIRFLLHGENADPAEIGVLLPAAFAVARGERSRQPDQPPPLNVSDGSSRSGSSGASGS